MTETSSKMVEITKLEERLIDNYPDLRVIARIRKELHKLYLENEEDYYIASELLSDLEMKIWNEINGVSDNE